MRVAHGGCSNARKIRSIAVYEPGGGGQRCLGAWPLLGHVVTATPNPFGIDCKYISVLPANHCELPRHAPLQAGPATDR